MNMGCLDALEYFTVGHLIAFNSSTLLPEPEDLVTVSCSTKSTLHLGRQMTTVWQTASALPPLADIMLAVILIVADLVAVSFNLFVIVLSIRNRKSLNHSDTFVLFLAMSDLGHPLLGYPMCIAAALQHGWHFGYIGCQVHGFLGFLFGVNSMMLLAFMSFSRFLSIAQPNFARNNGFWISTTLIAFSVLFALFWSLCPLLGWGRYDLEPYKTSCTLQWDYPDTSFVTASFLGCLAFPATVMCCSYGYIAVVALKTGQRRRRWNKRPEDVAWSKQELRLLKLTVAMCFLFLLNWSPYVVFAMIRAYKKTIHIPVHITPIPAVAAKCSHVIDPIIYCALNKKFRRFLTRSLTRNAPQCTGVDNTNTVLLRRILKVNGTEGGEAGTVDNTQEEVESFILTDSTADDKTSHRISQATVTD